MKCVICNGRVFGFGHNAEPVMIGICCDICNDIEVIPARIKNIMGVGASCENDCGSDGGDGGD